MQVDAYAGSFVVCFMTRTRVPSCPWDKHDSVCALTHKHLECISLRTLHPSCGELNLLATLPTDASHAGEKRFGRGKEPEKWKGEERNSAVITGRKGRKKRSGEAIGCETVIDTAAMVRGPSFEDREQTAEQIRSKSTCHPKSSAWFPRSLTKKTRAERGRRALGRNFR